MGAGYTRQSEANIVDEAVINADDFNAEFDAIESAFNATTGHSHDGTEGEGPQIDTAGIADDAVTPAKLDSTETYEMAGITLGGTTVTATAAEINFLDGVTSNIQDQLDASGGTTEDSTNQYAIPIYSEAASDVLQDSVENTYARIQSDGYIRVDSNNVVLASYSAGTPTIATTTSTTENVIIGINAGEDLSNGDRNTFIGFDAGKECTGEQNSVFIGNSAGSRAENGTINVAIGRRAGSAIVGLSSHNTFIGASAGGDTISPNNDGITHNTAVGAYALSDIDGNGDNAGIDNSAFGASSLSNVTTGFDNTGVGRSSGVSITTGSNNTCLGHNAGNSSSPFDFPLGSESNRVVVGNSAVTNAYISVAWTTTSDERDKTDLEDLNVGLDFINAVEPKTFHFDRRSQYYVYDNDGEIIDTPTPDGTHKTDQKFLGFSAQQVQEAVEASGLTDQIIIDSSDPDHYRMKETAFIPVLVKAVQELSARVEQLEAQLNNP